MGGIRWALWGKSFGNFVPAQAGIDAVLERLKRERDRMGVRIDRFYALRCGFTNRIAHGETDFDEHAPWFLESRMLADGAVVWGPRRAVAIFNGDCPVIALYEPRWDRMAVLHAGLRCLVREGDERNIVRTAFAEYCFDPDKVEVFVGFGIGPCCYGDAPKPKPLAAESGAQPLPAIVTKGPYAGQKATDLYALIAEEPKLMGVPGDHISWNKECTACAGREIENAAGYFYSNVYDGKNAGRNAALVWYE